MPVISKSVFKYYSVLPTELRIMIADEMQPSDICRFTRCSTSSKKEAEASKNYLYSLKIIQDSDNTFRTETEYGNREHHDGNAKFFSYSSSVQKSFKNQLKMHQSRIKKLVIGLPEFEIDFEIEKFDKLETLVLNIKSDVLKILSKIRKPLRILAVFGEGSHQIPVDWEGIYQVRKCIILPFLKFTYAQFLQFTAENIHVHIGYLTEEDVFNFIESWQQTTTKQNERVYEWNLENSDFSVPKLLNILGACHPNTESYTVDIPHKREGRRYGILIVHEDDTLKFVADWKNHRH